MKELGITKKDPRILKFAGYYTELAHSCFATAMT